MAGSAIARSATKEEERSGSRTVDPGAMGMKEPAGEAFNGRLAGASFSSRTTAPDLAAYARAHLAPLASPVPDVPNVDATLRWHDGQLSTDRLAVYPHLAGMERPDRDVYLAKLTAKVPCYEMGLTPEMTSTAAVEAITRLLREKPSL